MCVPANRHPGRPLHQRLRNMLRQLGDVRRDPPPHRTPHVLWRLNSSGNFAMLTAIHLASSRVNNFAADLRPRLVLEIDIRKRLPVVISDDKARGLFFNGPGRREAAARHCETFDRSIRQITTRAQSAHLYVRTFSAAIRRPLVPRPSVILRLIPVGWWATARKAGWQFPIGLGK